MRCGGAAALQFAVAVALLAFVTCSALEPKTTSAGDSTSLTPSMPQPAAAPETAAAAAVEAMAKLKAAKKDPPYYADFPHGEGALARELQAQSTLTLKHADTERPAFC